MTTTDTTADLSEFTDEELLTLVDNFKRWRADKPKKPELQAAYNVAFDTDALDEQQQYHQLVGTTRQHWDVGRYDTMAWKMRRERIRKGEAPMTPAKGAAAVKKATGGRYTSVEGWLTDLGTRRDLNPLKGAVQPVLDEVFRRDLFPSIRAFCKAVGMAPQQLRNSKYDMATAEASIERQGTRNQ
jgi:hypothetical protein